jgi:hypothetical protein
MKKQEIVVFITVRKLTRKYSTYHNEVSTFALSNGRICSCCDVNDSLFTTNKIVWDAAILIAMLVKHPPVHICSADILVEM